MKLQKLLYFSQLIHLAKHGEVLFEEPIYAFQRGSVVEEVRLQYKNSHQNLVTEANLMRYCFDDDEMDTINTTIAIFGDSSAQELSELNHLHQSWEKAYVKSRVRNSCNNFHNHNKEKSIIPVQDMLQYDLADINKVLEAYEMTSAFEEECKVINNVKFYYDPEEVTMNEHLLSYLESFPADETAYTVCIDESLGVIVF